MLRNIFFALMKGMGQVVQVVRSTDNLKAIDLHIVEKLTDGVSTLLKKKGHTRVEIPETGRAEEQDLSRHRSKSS